MTPSEDRPRGPMLLDTAAVVVAASAAGLTFDRAFAPATLAAVVLPSALVPAIGIAAAAWRAGLAVRIAVHLCSLALLFVLLNDAALALMAMTLPAPPDPALVAVPVGCTWLASAAGTELAWARARGGGLVVLLPAAPVLVYTTLLAPPTRLSPVPYGVLAACAAIQLVRSTVRPGGRVFGSAAGRAAVPLAAAAAVAFAAPPIVGTSARERVDPRDHLPQWGLPQSTVHPVDQVDGWLADPGRILFRARTDRPVRYWRLVALEDFDGTRWSPPVRYTRAGLGVPSPSPPAARAGETVSQVVTVQGLTGPFLPTVDRPVRIGAPVSAVDTRSGVLLTGASVGPGVTYRLTSASASPSGTAKCGDPVGMSSDDPALAVPPDLTGPLGQLAGTGRCTGSFDAFAGELSRRLGDGRHNVSGGPSSGGSVGALAELLRAGGSGTVVEFAAAFALGARAAGVPSRLVIGFEPASAVAGRSTRCTRATCGCGSTCGCRTRAGPRIT
ncbi:DUF3488 domain-containing protein [Phytohabitans houttuyneae]|uniref:Transglutaminase-like domain-containing protein n=1 Tax=Phytohabitans houttuyneae TaxID=1076126 RepID=A0A6V8KQ47_9ACTN|nr:DUF3488 domain-containing protein [Phytohabitans houttuyneae]GFJ84728.1 hypothetical protein Phou_089080 [Phytohabitans houttuyneae]